MRCYKGKGKHANVIHDYVFKRLSLGQQKLWGKLQKLDDLKKPTEVIEALLEKHGKLARQNMFVYAWTSSNFNISASLRKVNISRSTFTKWCQEKYFKELITEIEWHKKNFFENHLMTLVASGDSSATIFANKSFNADRGYMDKKGVTHDVNVHGGITVSNINVKDLHLSIECRKELLAAVRLKEKQDALMLEESPQTALPIIDAVVNPKKRKKLKKVKVR